MEDTVIPEEAIVSSWESKRGNFLKRGDVRKESGNSSD